MGQVPREHSARDTPATGQEVAIAPIQCPPHCGEAYNTRSCRQASAQALPRGQTISHFIVARGRPAYRVFPGYAHIELMVYNNWSSSPEH